VESVKAGSFLLSPLILALNSRLAKIASHPVIERSTDESASKFLVLTKSAQRSKNGVGDVEERERSRAFTHTSPLEKDRKLGKLQGAWRC